jgi:hypothetical protein
MARPSRPPVTFQVGLTPGDLAEAQYLLPHQLRQWAGQVDEVLCTVDVPPPGVGPTVTSESTERLCALIEAQMPSHPHLRWTEVDYSTRARREVSDTFYQGRPVPLRDHRDRPVHAFLIALLMARHEYVFHIDSDILFGGGSQEWIGEALELLQQRPDVIACSPLPGPPRADRRLLSQRWPVTPEPHGSPAYRFPTLSTRLFLLNRRRLVSELAPLRAEWPPLRPSVRTLLRGRRPHDILERVISRAMQRQGMFRVDFLGSAPGMWSIHPLDRSLRFKRLLPELIRRVEAGDVDDAQRGEYDLTEGMFRSTAARLAPA